MKDNNGKQVTHTKGKTGRVKEGSKESEYG
jgi:hypothetical protein